MEKVLITGGAGYLGCVLTPFLLRSGYAVRVLDRFQHRYPGLLECTRHANFQAVKGDCRDVFVLNKAKQGVDWVIPLAAIVGAPACDNDQALAFDVNYAAIEKLVKTLPYSCRVLFPNTNSGYGTSQEVCTEDTPFNPISIYGKTKTQAEKVILDRENSISFRFATVFGLSPRMRLDLMVNDFVWRAMHDRAVTLYEADFKRNYIYIHDVARAFLHGMRNFDKMKGRPYNVGLPDSLSKRELCQVIKKGIPDFHITEAQSGKDPDQRNYVVSSDRIKETGYRPHMSIDGGIYELMQGYKMFPTQEFRNA